MRSKDRMTEKDTRKRNMKIHEVLANVSKIKPKDIPTYEMIASVNTKFTDIVILHDGLYNITYHRSMICADKFFEGTRPGSKILVSNTESGYNFSETNIFKFLNDKKLNNFKHHGEKMIFVIDMDVSSFREKLDSLRVHSSEDEYHYNNYWYSLHPSIVTESLSYEVVNSYDIVTPVKY